MGNQLRIAICSDDHPLARATALAFAEIGADLTTWAPDEQVEIEGLFDLVFLCTVTRQALERRPLVEVDEASWAAVAESPVVLASEISALLAPHLRGRLLLVTPTLSLFGAPGLVPLATASEAQRALARSLAKAWGRAGVTVDVLAVPLRLLTDDPDADALPPSLSAPAMLVEAGDVAAAVVDLALGMRVLTGATLCLDGGTWMG